MRSDAAPVRPIRAAIFDVGNVLIHLRPMEKIMDSLAAQGGAAKRKTSSSFDLLQLRSDPVLDRFERGQATDGEFFAAVRQAFGGHLRDEQIRRVYEEILGDPIQGMPELIHDLRARGVRVVGLTDISPGHLALIAQYPAVKALEAVVASCQTTYRKPEPEAFRAALAAAGTEPEETLFTDDQPANVEGARKLGLQAVVFSGAEELRTLLEM